MPPPARGRTVFRVTVTIIAYLICVGNVQAGGAPATIPVHVLCGKLTLAESQTAIYHTRIDVTFLRTDGENGEIIVSPGIVAGEVNPGETVTIDCEEILDERESFSGTVTVQVFPGDEFQVNVVYDLNFGLRP